MDTTIAIVALAVIGITLILRPWKSLHGEPEATDQPPKEIVLTLGRKSSVAEALDGAISLHRKNAQAGTNTACVVLLRGDRGKLRQNLRAANAQFPDIDRAEPPQDSRRNAEVQLGMSLLAFEGLKVAAIGIQAGKGSDHAYPVASQSLRRSWDSPDAPGTREAIVVVSSSPICEKCFVAAHRDLGAMVFVSGQEGLSPNDLIRSKDIRVKHIPAFEGDLPVFCVTVPEIPRLFLQ